MSGIDSLLDSLDPEFGNPEKARGSSSTELDVHAAMQPQHMSVCSELAIDVESVAGRPLATRTRTIRVRFGSARSSILVVIVAYRHDVRAVASQGRVSFAIR